MDDFGSTFFDLSSSPNYSLCSASQNNNIASNSSFTFNDTSSTSNNLLQAQVDDLDSILLNVSNSTEISGSEKNSLSALLDNLTDDPVSSSANPQPLNIDSLIDQGKNSQLLNNDNLLPQQSNLLQYISKTETSTEIAKPSKPSNMVQVKLVKPIGVINSLGSNGMIPVTVHSVSGQRHSVIRTTLPMCGPRVHLLPVNHSMITQASIKQEKDEIQVKQPKVSLTDSSHLRIIVCNVVASFRVRCHLNLRQIALQSIDVIYRKEAQKVVMRMRKPKCTAYMWSSGKIVCTGSTSEVSAKKAAKKFCRRLLKLGFQIRFADYRIVNVLVVSKMPYAINIRGFSQAHKGRNCSYEPELHPGVTFRDTASKATLKIFSTGSVTVTGRSVGRATEAIRNVYPLLKDFYKFEKPNIDMNYEDALPLDDEDLS